MSALKTVQALSLLLVLALAASCEVTRQYSSRLFASRDVAVRRISNPPQFLHSGTDSSSADWVNTDTIMGRDSSRSITRLDELAATVPAITTNVPATTAATGMRDSLSPAAFIQQNQIREDPTRTVRLKRSRN